MLKTRPLPQEAFAEHMRSSVDTTEVQRLIYDISTCTVEWEEPPGVTVPLQARGVSKSFTHIPTSQNGIDGCRSCLALLDCCRLYNM
mgnify:CR=1 FL=1